VPAVPGVSRVPVNRMVAHRVRRERRRALKAQLGNLPALAGVACIVCSLAVPSVDARVYMLVPCLVIMLMWVSSIKPSTTKRLQQEAPKSVPEPVPEAVPVPRIANETPIQQDKTCVCMVTDKRTGALRRCKKDRQPNKETCSTHSRTRGAGA
jgi:hypothetical protein